MQAKISEYGDGDKYVADSVTVSGHRTWDERVVIEHEGHCFIVIASDLIEAVRRCSR